MRTLVDVWIAREGVVPGILWYHTPAALAFSGLLEAPLVVHDCVDDIDALSGDMAELRRLRRQLLFRSHIVIRAREDDVSLQALHASEFAPGC